MGESIVIPEVLWVFLLVVVNGYFILHQVVKRKWGYTKEREKQLEEFGEMQDKK